MYAVKNTAKRWLTTVNYDLLIYQDKLVVARGISWRTFADDLTEAHVWRKVTGRSDFETVDEARVSRTARGSAEELLERGLRESADPCG